MMVHCTLTALDEFRAYQVATPEIEERTELVFSTPVHDADDRVTPIQRAEPAR